MWFTYFIKKLAYLLGSLWIVASLTFILMKVTPGDPFSEEQSLRADMHHALLESHGLNAPWYQQYGTYLFSLLQGDLGYSLKYSGRSINRLIQNSFPVSALLGLEALCIALTTGLFFGSLAALRKGTWQDHLVLLWTTMGLSMPSFILAALLQYVLAIKLGLLPLARWGSFSQSLLPSFALAALPAAFIARLMRTSLSEVMQTDYIKAARAKGLPAYQIVTSHALPHALGPVLSYLGQLMANILVGSVVIEKIFSIPGLGGWFVNSIMSRDYPLIMGLTLFYSSLLLLSIFLVDLAYAWLDPRIRLGFKES